MKNLTSIITIALLTIIIITASGCKEVMPGAGLGEENIPEKVWETVHEAEEGCKYQALCFSDENNGWAVGDSGAMLRTTDGGNSWKAIESGTEKDLHCICFSGSRNGWTGGAYGTLGTTTDGGETWTWQKVEESSGGLFMDIHFTDSNTGWLVNNYGKIFHTEDGGETWIQQYSCTDRALTSVFFENEKTGWVIKIEHTVLSTQDGGDTWNTNEIDISLGSSAIFTDIFFINDKEGWITTTTMISSDSTVTTAPVLHTTDGGETWSVQATPPDQWLKNISMTDSGTGWLTGSRKVFRTEDGGESWTPLLDSGGDPFVDICLPDGRNPLVLSYTGRINKYVSEAKAAAEPEIRQIGTDLYYSQQSVREDTLVVLERVNTGDSITQYISAYNLHTGETERMLELGPESSASAPSIHKNFVVWAAYDKQNKENSDIFLLDLDTGETRQITDDSYMQREPVIYDDTIVWMDNRHGTGESYPYPPPLDVYSYNLRTGEEKRITAATTAEGYSSPAISGNFIVWTDCRHAEEMKRHASNEPGYNNEIYLYDLATGKERRITSYEGNDRYPAVHGVRVVWLRQKGYREADVFAYDLAKDKEMQISHSGYADFQPSIHGSRIVWTDARVSKGNTNNDVVEIIIDSATGKEERREPGSDIYLYDLETKQELKLTEPLPHGFSLWTHPCIYGNFIVYELNRQIGSVTCIIELEQ